MLARPNRGFWPVTALLSSLGVFATIAAALFRKKLFA
jgi:hypothetical protein